MNTDYFWTYRTDLPPGIGVKTFGLVHIAWAATVVLLIAFIVFVYKRQNRVNRRRIQVVAASLMVLGYILRWTWLACIGHYTFVESLPLQLCSISVMVEFLAVLTGNATLKEFSYSCSLPGGLASLIVPGMGPYPFFSFIYLQFALAHATLVLIPLLWVIVDGYRPSLRHFPKCAGLLLTFAGTAWFVNSRIGSNYMFLSHTRDNTLLTPFENSLGYPGYLIPYILFVMLAWVILYTPWVIHSRLQSVD